MAGSTTRTRKEQFIDRAVSDSLEIWCPEIRQSALFHLAFGHSIHHISLFHDIRCDGGSAMLPIASLRLSFLLPDRKV